jgi:hypothetical protein
MNGEVSQLVALCSAANGVLAKSFSCSELYPGYADFKFCNSVRFIEFKKTFFRKERETLRYGDPNEWLRSLLSSNTERAWLSYATSDLPDPPGHKMAGFVGGGGTWRLVVSGPRATDIWYPRWDVTKQSASDDRIWGVTYAVVRASEQLCCPTSELARTAEELRAALQAANDFAKTHDVGHWAEIFARALSYLDLSRPAALPEYIQFVCLESYPDLAQRLISASYAAWVFGGMGSWNDLYFETNDDNLQYEEISRVLYAAVMAGIEHATWAFGLDMAT